MVVIITNRVKHEQAKFLADGRPLVEAQFACRVEPSFVRRYIAEQLATACADMLLLDFLDPPDLSIDEPYFDAVRMRSGFGQDILDHPASKFSGSLVLFEDD